MTQLEIIFVAALVVKLLAELILEKLNRGHVVAAGDALPKGLEGVMDEETYAKANRYTVEKSSFGSWQLVYDSIIVAAVVLSGFLPWLFAWWTGGEAVSNMSSAMFIVGLLVILGIPSLPFEYWSQFKIEEKYGFNRSSIGLWITDKIKGAVVGVIIGFLLLWLILNLVTWMGTYWWIYASIAVILFQLLMIALYPMLIMPLFNKLTPLEDGPLKDRLMSMSDRAGFKAQAIQVIDGSKRSSHSNAFFTGFGKFRRIVLYDTLIEQLSEEELEAVLAHEIGHYKKGHIPKMIATSAVMMVVGFWAIDLLAFSEWFFQGFHFQQQSLGIAIVLFMILGGLFTFWLSPIFNAVSRKHEYEADKFAKDVVGSGEPLSGALRRLSEKNLSNLNPHPAYSGFHYSHPTLLEREKALGIE